MDMRLSEMEARILKVKLHLDLDPQCCFEQKGLKAKRRLLQFLHLRFEKF